VKTQKPWSNPTPITCGVCEATKLPLVQSGVLICTQCDGWPPILEPPTVSRPDPMTHHVQGCGAGKDPGKRCICPWNR
jgi:hypothetical protein